MYVIVKEVIVFILFTFSVFFYLNDKMVIICYNLLTNQTQSSFPDWSILA